MKKAEKVNTINAWLANSEYHKIQQSGIRDEDNEAKDDDGDLLNQWTVMSLMMRMM